VRGAHPQQDQRKRTVSGPTWAACLPVPKGTSAMLAPTLSWGLENSVGGAGERGLWDAAHLSIVHL
jgi:hypothetical protein